MAKADSGIQSPSRYFSFRWAYLFLTIIIWAFFLSLVLLPGDFEYWWSPDFIAWHTIVGHKAEHLELRLHGVLGLYFEGSFWERWNDWGDVFEPIHLAAISSIALLIALIACYVIPASGNSVSLIAIRGVHTRGKITAAIVLGIMAAASFAGFIDLFKLGIDTLFIDAGIWPDIHRSSSHTFEPFNIVYRPQIGIAHPISWISVALITVSVGVVALFCLSYALIGGDRYWQAERWTLVYSLLALAMILAGLLGVQQDYWAYRTCDQYLGGCYSMFIVGWFALAWAWTSRTIMFMMIKRYEFAPLKAEQTNCLACGYDLQMLTSKRCPECGIHLNSELIDEIQRRMPEGQQSTHAESRSTTR